MKANGWDVVLLCMELGAWGYINNEWGAMTKAVGIKSSENKHFGHGVSTVAQRCSYIESTDIQLHSYYIYLSWRNMEWLTRLLLRVLNSGSNTTTTPRDTTVLCRK